MGNSGSQSSSRARRAEQEFGPFWLIGQGEADAMEAPAPHSWGELGPIRAWSPPGQGAQMHFGALSVGSLQPGQAVILAVRRLFGAPTARPREYSEKGREYVTNDPKIAGKWRMLGTDIPTQANLYPTMVLGLESNCGTWNYASS